MSPTAVGRRMEILRYTAFSADPDGGNPAGVVVDASGMSDEVMQAVAADVGYSETAFLVPEAGRVFGVRYFSPQAEVPFCGHASIASAVAVAERTGPGELLFRTPVGDIPIETTVQDGRVTASLTSVAPRVTALPPEDLAELLAALGWGHSDLDPALPPRVGFAGNLHPILAATTRERLADLDYDFDRLAALMAAREWTTVDLIHREAPGLFWSRNPFPPGGVVEDPATGAAAAAFGGYLREVRIVHPPATVTIRQGDDMGRPGVLAVDIPPTGGIRVTGTATLIDS